MTVSEAIKENKEIVYIYDKKDSGVHIDYLGPLQNSGTPIKHIFKLTHLDDYNNCQTLLFVDDEWRAYYLGTNIQREQVFLGVKKEKKTVWINMYLINGQPETGICTWESKETAEKNNGDNDVYLGAHPVTVYI